VAVNGVVYRDGVLWIANMSEDDLPGQHEIVAADADTGEILGRFGPEQGVSSRPDDLVMTRRGTIYWTGLDTGDIGVLRPGGRISTLTNVGPGVNPIVLGPDHDLYVARFYLDLGGPDPQPWSGLYRIDPRNGATTVINPDVQANAFAFGPDGQIYAPGELIPSASRLLRIDPTTGQTTEIPADLSFYAPSVRFPPRSRGEAPTTAYALSLDVGRDALVKRIDITTGQPVAPEITLPFQVADNMTFAPDGRLFVTGYNIPVVAVVEVDGSIRTIPIGTP
jgi:sugar lactone lactonase YvrE